MTDTDQKPDLTDVEIRWSGRCLAYVFRLPGASDDDPPLIDWCSHDIREVLAAAERRGLRVVAVHIRPQRQLDAMMRQRLVETMRVALCHGPAGVDAFERAAVALAAEARGGILG